MKPQPFLSALVLAVVVSASAHRQLFAQSASAGPQTPAAASAPTAVPSLVPYSGIALASSGKALSGEASITFEIFKDEQGGEPLFVETQTVAVDKSGKYTAQLGATNPNGLPGDLFATGEARWLEVQVAGQSPQPRVLLASVPYALKAGDAATLGGLPASAFALAGSKSSLAASEALPAGVVSNASSDVTTTGGTSGYLPVFTGASTVGNSILYSAATGIGVGDVPNSSAVFDVNGKSIWRGLFNVVRSGNAITSTGYASFPMVIQASVYNSSANAMYLPNFQLQAEPTGNNTASTGATFNFLYTANNGTAAETGLYFNPNGTIHFAPGQTFPGTADGTVTGVTAGTDLTGGGTSGVITLNLNTAATDSRYARLAAANAFTGNQTVNGTVAATSFSGSGAALTGVTSVNSAELGGLAPGSYAELAVNNTFSGTQSFANVGVGTATPRSLLELQAPALRALGPVLTLTNTLGGAGAGSAVDFNTIQPSTIGTYNPMARIVAQDATRYSDNLLFQSNNPAPIAPNSGLQTNMIITSTGLVGIGTTTPTSQLQVNGTVTANSFVGNGAGITGITNENASQLGGLLPSAFAQVGVANTFAASQTVNGSVTASYFAGSGAGLYGVLAANSAQLGGLTSEAYAQLAANNTFTGNQSITGTVSAGTVNAVNGFDLGGSPFASGSATDGDVFVGFQAGANNSNAEGNTAIGFQALNLNNTGYENTASGIGALYNNVTGYQNTANGAGALQLTTTGLRNTAIGFQALLSNTSGGFNVGVGYLTGLTADSSNATGSNNTVVGANTVFATGSISNATALGANAEVTESNTMVLGCIAGTIFYGVNVCPTAPNVGIGTTTPDNLLTVNGSADKPGGGSWGTYSDRRLKNVNGSFGGGLDQVMQLRPIRYRYKADNALGIRDAGEHVGVVAQEVQRVIPEAVTENGKGYLLVNNDPILWSMVNAIQQQQKEIEEQRMLNREQTQAIAAQQKLIRAQGQAMRTLMAEVRETRKTLRQAKAQAASNQPVLVAAK